MQVKFCCSELRIIHISNRLIFREAYYGTEMYSLEGKIVLMTVSLTL
jgi:hypothetical protein